MIPQNFLKNLARNFRVSDSEFEALSRALKGQPMHSIAKELDISKEALQKRLGEVYKKFEIRGRGPGKLAKLQQILLSQYQRQVTNFTNGTASDGISAQPDPVQSTIEDVTPSISKGSYPETAIAKINPRIDWGDAPDVPIFYGRNPEFTVLKQYIVKDAYRLVALLGIGGIGKTTLAVRTVQEIQGEFDYCIWRSLKERPLMSDILNDLLKFLSPQPETDLLENTETRIGLLLKYLSSARCLVILDQVDSILQSSNCYQQGYENYAELFHQIVTSPHQSCLLLISWYLHPELIFITTENSKIKVLPLNGLDEQSVEKIIYSAKRFSSSPENSLFSELLQLYGNNPLLLKIVTTNFDHIFSGNFTQFIQQATLIIQNILRDFLQKNSADLSDIENYILCYLALKNKPVSCNDLKSNLSVAGEMSDLQPALESLIREEFLVKDSPEVEDIFTLNPEIKQYITHQLLAKYFNQVGHKNYLAGEFQTAKYYLSQAIRFNPDLAPAHYNLGATYEQLQDLAKAINHYQIAAKFNNRGAYAAISNLARLEIISGNLETSINLILPILGKVKDDLVLAALSKNLGWAYFLENRYNEAELQLLKSLELNQVYSPTHYLLAQVKEAQGNIQEALVYYENFLKYNQSDHKTQGINWRLPELDIWKINARQRLSSINN